MCLIKVLTIIILINQACWKHIINDFRGISYDNVALPNHLRSAQCRTSICIGMYSRSWPQLAGTMSRSWPQSVKKKSSFFLASESDVPKMPLTMIFIDDYINFFSLSPPWASACWACNNSKWKLRFCTMMSEILLLSFRLVEKLDKMKKNT